MSVVKGDNYQLKIEKGEVIGILDKTITTYANKPGEVKIVGDGLTLVVSNDVTITGNGNNVIVSGEGKNVTIDANVKE